METQSLTSTLRRSPKDRIALSSFSLALAAFVSTWSGAKFGGLAVVDLFLAIALALFALDGIFGRRRLVLSWWMLAPTGLGFFLLSLTTVVGGQPLVGSRADQPDWVLGDAALAQTDGSLLFLLRLAIATTLVALLVRSEIDTHGPRAGVRLLKFLAAGGVVSGLAAVLSTYGLLPEFVQTYRFLTTRAVGLAFHPNSLSQSMVVIMPVLFFLSWNRTFVGRIERAAWVLGLMVCVYALYLADSRGALIVGAALAIVLVSMSRLRSGGGTWIIPSALALIVGASLWLPSLLEGTRFQSGNASAETSTQARASYLASSVEQFLSNPVAGVGLGLGSGVMVPALIAASGGLILLVGFYTFMLTPVKRMVLQRKDDIVWYCLVSAMAVIAMGFFNNSLSERFDYWTLCIGFGVATWTSSAVAESTSATGADNSPGPEQPSAVSRV